MLTHFHDHKPIFTFFLAYILIHVHIYIWPYIYIYIYVCTYLRLRTSTPIYLYMFTNIQAHVRSKHVYIPQSPYTYTCF
jgi:hypothetical protein